jgi:capsular polysaccharide biosynthesis protein
VPVVISNSVPQSGLQALQKLTKREIIQIDPQRVYKIKKLHVSAPVAQVLDTTKVPWADGVFVNFESLVAFRQECLSLINSSSTPSRRIFLKRDSGHRNLVNGEKLEKIAKDFGYEVIDVAGMGWEEQVTLFTSAEVVVGAGGAVMANYIFLPKNAKVLSLTSEYLADFVLPAYLTAVAGASFTYLTGKPKVTKFSRSSTQHMMHSGFTIKESSFKNALINLSK